MKATRRPACVLLQEAQVGQPYSGQGLGRCRITRTISSSVLLSAPPPNICSHMALKAKHPPLLLHWAGYLFPVSYKHQRLKAPHGAGLIAPRGRQGPSPWFRNPLKTEHGIQVHSIWQPRLSWLTVNCLGTPGPGEEAATGQARLPDGVDLDGVLGLERVKNHGDEVAAGSIAVAYPHSQAVVLHHGGFGIVGVCLVLKLNSLPIVRERADVMP